MNALFPSVVASFRRRLHKEFRVTFKTLGFATALVSPRRRAYAQAPAPAPAAAPATQGPPPQPALGPNEWNIDTAHSTAASRSPT
jgi:hypothetical protein